MTTDPIFGSPTPSTPYAGSSGHSGSVASRDRAVREDADGTSGHRQQVILSVLDDAGAIGMTSAEFRDEKYALGHHGNISGALSVLHKEGKIACLKTIRGRCHVYLSLTAAERVDPDALRPFGGKPDGVDSQVDAFVNGMDAQAAIDAGYAELAKDHEPSRPRKPLLTEDEKRLVARATLSARRFSGAHTMPVQVTSMRALLAIIERITT